jgi:hypothetical protein
MPEILRTKLTWTGFAGAPGYTNFYFSEFVEAGYTQAMADGAVAKAHDFSLNIAALCPPTVTITTDPTVEIIQADTGDLVGFFSTVPGAAAVGARAGTYSAASGACFSWGTNGVRKGRRVRGRTFAVPLAGSCYQSDGTINDTDLATLRQIGVQLLSNTGVTDFGIWSRPSTKTATDGVWFPAQTSSVKDKVAILRSRRD